MAITTRMMTGMMVQATSRTALWLTLVGTAFTLARNFHATYISSPSTNTQMAVMIQNSSRWKVSIMSITGEADCWKPYWKSLICA